MLFFAEKIPKRITKN